MFPEPTVAEIARSAWQRPAIFDWLQQAGNVEEREMARTFNCGIGFVVVVADNDAERAMAALIAHGETVRRIGHVRARTGDEPQTQVV